MHDRSGLDTTVVAHPINHAITKCSKAFMMQLLSLLSQGVSANSPRLARSSSAPRLLLTTKLLSI